MVASVERTSSVQALNPAVDSTGLAGGHRRGLFQHLRGSMFCGALAKCALGDFGCDLFQRLWGWVRGDPVTLRARTARRPPYPGICGHHTLQGKEIGRNRTEGGIAVGILGQP